MLNRMGLPERGKAIVYGAVCIGIAILFISMIRALRKKRSILIGERLLIVDGLPLDASEIRRAVFHKHFIELEADTRRRAHRNIRFAFKGTDTPGPESELRAWLRRHGKETRID